MGAVLHHLAAVDDQDLVGGQDGAQPVGYDNAGALGHDPFECVLDQRLGLAVEAAGGFVQYQNTRVFENHARQGDALLFAAAQAVAPFPDDGVVTIRQIADEMMNIGGTAGGFQLGLAGVQAGVKQVGANRVSWNRKVSWVTMPI